MSGESPSERAARGVAATAGRVVRVCRAVAFWVACLAPVAYVPLFVLPAEWWSPEVLGAAVGVHALALVVGHDHDAGGRR